MATQIDVDITGAQGIEAKLARLAGRETVSAVTMAINKTAAKATTAANREIRSRFNIRADQVRGSMTIIKARRDGQDLSATVSIFGSPSKQGRSMNVVRFMERSVSFAQARKRRKAGELNHLHFQFMKGGGKKTIEGAFIGNKGRTVFRRTGKARLPIEPVQMIGVSQMFSTRSVRSRVMATIEKEYRIELDRAINLVLSRR